MHAISQAARVTARGTGCNTPSRANSKHSSAARKQEEGTKCTMSMFLRVGLGPFVVLIVLAVVIILNHVCVRLFVSGAGEQLITLVH